MPKIAKKHAFPTKPCPKCGKPIHARLHKHEACGWVMNGQAAPAAAKPAAKKKVGRPKKIHATQTGGPITFDDIAAVKAVVDRLGAAKVQELAQVLIT